MSDPAAPMVECFSSVQGEGTLVGLRQAFIRFAGCNLECDFCDTPGMSGMPEGCLLEQTPGRRDFLTVPNPVASSQVVSLIERWTRGWPGIHHSVSVTGGEPLLQGEMLKELLPGLRALLPVYLETNGTLPDALAPLLPHLDHIGMDIKLPSAYGGAGLWDVHRAFLELAATAQVFVKVVIGSATLDEEIERSSALVASVDPAIPLILQPMTLPDGTISLPPIRMLELQELCRELKEVRVIPQTHKFLGQL